MIARGDECLLLLMTISLFRLDLKVRQDCGGKADGRIPQTSEGRDAGSDQPTQQEHCFEVPHKPR